MAFTITADLPLGTYRGAGADGRVEAVPAVSRLYSALLSAAGFGPRAIAAGEGMLGPCEADELALRWLEENPPDGVSVPTLHVNRGRAIAFRSDGTIKKTKGSVSFKKLPKSPDTSVAVGGMFAWTWSARPPQTVVAALEALCADVAYLGTSESPVRLQISHDETPAPTHVLDTEAGLFARTGGHDVELPLTGRLAELRTAHRAGAAVPSQAKDRWTTDEVSRSEIPTRTAVALARYAPTASPPADVPWPQVLLLSLDPWADNERPAAREVVPERERVRLAVNVHRALISAIGEGAPPLVTGIYPDQAGAARRPANRLAIQVLEEAMPVDLGGAPAAVALLVPQDADPTDLDVLAAAIASLRFVRGAGGRRYGITGVRAVSGATFWAPKPPGTMRLWATAPPAIPDTRGASGGSWTFAHAALLSLGYVWRDQLPPVAGRGDARQRATVDAVSVAGAAVVRAAPLRQSDVRPYVHKVNEHAVVRPYRAQLWLGDLCPDQVVQAIGQTRHLGGGLLVPVDLPAGGGER